MTGDEMKGPKREYPEIPLVGVGTVTIKNGKILLVRRAFDPGAGKWSIPGGLVEVGEKLSEAAARETEEETGIQVEILELINVFDMIDLDDAKRVKYHYVLVDFLSKPIGGKERVCDEVTDIKWVTFDEAKTMDLTKTARKALEELFGSSIA
ncbi:MAG TPA: NUDIX hydrolase [Thermoplasmata archaeon]|nr:NUDIX hydrolase [Thermoplasmata archaeon]